MTDPTEKKEAEEITLRCNHWLSLLSLFFVSFLSRCGRGVHLLHSVIHYAPHWLETDKGCVCARVLIAPIKFDKERLDRVEILVRLCRANNEEGHKEL